jgi:outer membrane protein OmpU
VATAGVAAADVTLGGGANAGLRYTGAGDAFLHYEIDIDIKAAGETENGLSFGASLDLDENSGSTDPEVFVSGAFGTVTIGAVDIATDGLGLPDLGFDGIGMDDDVEALRNAGSADVVYSHSIAGVSVTLSYGVGGTAGADASEGDMGLLLGYKFDAFSIEAGIATDDQTSNRGMGVELGYKANGITVNALWASQDVKVGTDTSGYGLYVGYTMDAITVGASYADTDAAGDGEDYGLGFSYNLGGGLSVVGGVGSVDRPGAAVRADVWDLGLTMSF